MKNALSYYYGLDVSNIHQRDKNFYFEYNNYQYILTKYENNDIKDIYELSTYLNKIGILCHQFILNKSEQLLTQINENNYVLMKMYVERTNININDLIELNNISYKKNDFNWYNLWIEKIDYLEYQMSQMGKKYPLIRQSFSYYIGLSENAISLIRNIKDNLYFSLAHKRISCKDTKQELYNPLNFVVDLRIRDACEYFKSCFFNNLDINDLTINYLYINNFNYEECICFISRMLFPTYYFDAYEKIINNEIDEIKINNIIKLVNDYEKYLKNIYFYLRTNKNIPNIEWLN